MYSRFRCRAGLAAAAIFFAATSGASAAPVALGGSPLNVLVDDQGELQAVRQDVGGTERGIFYPSTSTTGNGGFFLAFPNMTSGENLQGTVYGFENGFAGPSLTTTFTPVSQGPVQGAGTAASPLTQVTRYAVHPAATDRVLVTQTTTYVNGSQEFRVRWVVKNLTGGALNYKALAAADFFFEGSDRGTGIYTQGPPQFIGGTNADSGSSGGFVEVSPVWSHYQALAFPDVWSKVADADMAQPFDDTVVGDQVDNAGGVEWDGQTLANANDEKAYELIVRSAVPSALQMNPTNAGSRQGVPVNVTATATDTNGQPYAGKTLRYGITGVNPASGAVTLGPTGSGVITDPGTNAGGDTIVAYVDFNNDATRQPVEPQASALATFVDNVPPSCTLKVSGDRPGGGGGAGKPLTITVRCGETVTVTVVTSMDVLGGGGPKASASKRAKKKRVRIKLKRVTRTIAPGRAVPVKLKIPRKVARRYAGRKVRFTIKVTAKDTAGNVKRVSRSKTVKLAPLRRPHRARGA